MNEENINSTNCSNLYQYSITICISRPTYRSSNFWETGYFIVTGPKFSTESHDAIRTAIGKWFSSACYMSQQNNMDVTVDSKGNATIIIRWATKEAFIHDQKIECDALQDFRMTIGKFGGVKPTDLKFRTVTSIVSSPR